MKLVAAYLIAMCLLFGFILVMALSGVCAFVNEFKLAISCAATGGLGGVLYCMRGIYLNAAVKGNWKERWEIWYFLRPLVSFGCGAVSYLFLKAGLLVLESDTKPSSSELGFYALAFVAGFNVDRFIQKIEDVSEAIWGIKKSRASRFGDNDAAD